MLTSRSDPGLPCNKFKIAFKPSDVIYCQGHIQHTKSFLVLDDTLSSESLCKSKLSISKESKYTNPDRNLIANLLEATNICKLFTAGVDNVLS